ncbi:MAG TPA: ribonuclease HII [Candidatus Obscuribacterales bacterium]
MARLLHFDSQLKGACPYLVGIDEVGRGCLAGPVVAAAVILPEIKKGSTLARSLKELDDSKQLTAVQRLRLADAIRSSASYAIDQASPEEIDTINILQASLLAMRRALLQLMQTVAIASDSTLVAIDGNKTIKEIEFRQVAVVKGDSLSASIAAASVVAKVHRDELMIKLGEDFPHYRWDSNKGYGSHVHRLAIKEHGTSIWHRKSFLHAPPEDVEQLELALDFD